MENFLFPLLLIEASGGKIRGRTRVQKLTFLYQSQARSPIAKYEFYPWDYGPYSSELQEYMNELVRRRLVEELPVDFDSDGPKKVYEYRLTTAGTDFLARSDIPKIAMRELGSLCEAWGDTNLDQLVRHVYAQAPEYTVRSKYES